MVGVAVIGAGSWGKNLVRNFASLGGAELKYICDLDAEARKAMSRLYPQATVTDDIGHNLASAAAQSQPYPALLALFNTNDQSSSSSRTSLGCHLANVADNDGKLATASSNQRAK